MLGGIESNLEGIISDIQLEMLGEAVQAMELFKYYDTVSQLSIYVAGAGQQEPIMIQAMVFAIVEEGLNELLASFEIGVLEATITEKTAILRGMYYMENASESEFISTTIENSESVKDAFITLLEFYTGKTADDFFPLISDEENSYLTKLYELHKTRSNLAAEDIMPANESAVDRCRKFMAKYPQTLLQEAVFIERYTPGISNQLLFNVYNERLQQLYPHALEQLSVEIVGLMCLSNVLNKGFSAEVKKKLSDIIPDQGAAARMVIDIDNITMELGLYAS